MKKTIFLFSILAGLTAAQQAGAQSVGIGSSSFTPNTSSILEIKSDASPFKGLLIPRMTAANRTSITSPATGLLVFQTDAPIGFWYYNGSSWIQLSTTTGTVTSIATNNGITGGTITTSGTIGLTGQALALHNLSTTGLITLISAGNVTGRTITGSANQIDITNGNGVSGNPNVGINVTFPEELRANVNLTGGGNITLDASHNLLWTSRFIVISNGRGSNFSTNGYFDITCPTSGTITGVGGSANVTATASGIPLAAWSALYYILPIGSGNGTVAANFRIASYTSNLDVPESWILLAVRNGDDQVVRLGNGVLIKAGQTWASGSSAINVSGSANYVAKFTSANTVGNSQIFDDGTNVGVGTAAPGVKLDVQGASGIRIGNSTYDANLVFGNSAAWKSGIRVYDNGDAEMRIWHANTNGQIVLATGYNGDQSSSMPTDGLFIDQNKVGIGYASPSAATGKLVVNGNVGIGTTTPSVKLDVIGTAKANAYSQNNNGLRITSPDGASYVTSTSSVTGAIKITLPQYRTSTMMRMTIKIYQYTTDQSYTIDLGGYNYGSGGWYNTFANVTSTSGANLNVRFGYDGTPHNCIWIGETSSTWSYPQVFVTDFEAGYSNYSTDQWDDGWAISFATAFNTIETTANPAFFSGNGFIKNQYVSAQTASQWISGETRTGGWFRSSSGSTGWYSEPYSSGIYATTTGEVATYNGSYFRITGSANGSGNLRFDAANPYIYASSYFVAPGGAYFNSGTVYTEAQYQCRGGIHNDGAANLTIAGGTSGTTYFSGPISGMSGYYPSNNMIRLTPNLHLNSTAGYAVILNWDNGTTGTAQTLRIGNGAGSDVFDVLANGNLGIGVTSPSYKIHVQPASSDRFGIYAIDYNYTAGSGYTNSTVRSMITGSDFDSQVYEFGVSGFGYNDYTRCGGLLGAQYNGSYWGSLGYKNSGSTGYGLYYTSAGSGSGYMNNNGIVTGIGAGGYGGVMGGWSRGEVLGFTSAGELYASYNLGNEYTSGVSADIVTLDNKRVAVYTVTSNDIKVYADGSGQLVNGKCKISFDNSFTEVISKEGKPTITVTPNGECNGLFTIEISSDGFTVKELNNGSSNVEFSWIAIGRRVDAGNLNNLPEALTDKNFDNNMKDVMFNENNKEQSAKPIWWDGTKIRFDAPPVQNIIKKEELPKPDNLNNSNNPTQLWNDQQKNMNQQQPNNNAPKSSDYNSPKNKQ